MMNKIFTATLSAQASTLNRAGSRRFVDLISLGLMLGLLNACATNSQRAADDDRQNITLRFAAEIDGKPMRCGEAYEAVGTTKVRVTPTDFRFFVSSVELLDRAGRAVTLHLEQDGVWQLDRIALLDFEDGTGPCRNGTPAVNTTIRGWLPRGDYVGVRFTLGLPFERNHADPTTAPAPLNNTAMFWNWQGGYKFLRVDLATPRPSPAATTSNTAPNTAPMRGHGTGAASGFPVHLGSTQCASPAPTQAPMSCVNSNRVHVQLDSFDPARSVIVADIATVLARADLRINTPGTAPGCMSFPKDADCPPIMAALGLTYDGVASSKPQRLFSVR
jgi:uncharacterized repeat protein (TIGR04052 family)